MAEPRFDKTTGRWYIRIRTGVGEERVKKLLPKHPGWKKLDRMPRFIPAEVLAYARPYQDMDARARIGLPIDLPKATPLAKYVESYQDSARLEGMAESSLVSLEVDTRQFLEFCKARKVENVQAVSPVVCREFLESGAKDGKRGPTMARKKGLLSPIFARAEAEGLIPRNPWKGVAIPGKRQASESPFWTDAEVERIAAQLKGWHRDMFLVGIHSGFRIDGLGKLRWRDVLWHDPQFPSGSLWCRHAKGGKPYRIPLFPALREVLERRRSSSQQTGPDDWIFPGDVEGHVGPKALNRAIGRALHRAGLPVTRRRCHAMRETFGTRCGARGVHPRTLMQWMNHATIQQTLKYIHYDASAEASEVAKLT